MQQPFWMSSGMGYNMNYTPNYYPNDYDDGYDDDYHYECDCCYTGLSVRNTRGHNNSGFTCQARRHENVERLRKAVSTLNDAYLSMNIGQVQVQAPTPAAAANAGSSSNRGATVQAPKPPKPPAVAQPQKEKKKEKAAQPPPQQQTRKRDVICDQGPYCPFFWQTTNANGQPRTKCFAHHHPDLQRRMDELIRKHPGMSRDDLRMKAMRENLCAGLHFNSS
jgi:hypothetical protein